MSLGEHLEEFRIRLFYALGGLLVTTIVGFYFGKNLVELFKKPYIIAMEMNNKTPDLVILTITGGFTTYLKVSLVTGLVLGSPWILYHLWMFISAGLYHKERRAVMIAVPFSVLLFITGSLFFMFVVSIPVLNFFIDINDWLELEQAVTFQSHISMMISMILVFGMAFQLPLVLFVLAKIGLVPLRTLRKYRKHAAVGSLIASALLTPPDPFSQLSLAIPLYMLYELGIILVRVFVGKGHRDEIEKDAPTE